MAPPTLYVAITNHGFGHTTRAAAVAATVQAMLPEVRLIITTTAPRWLLECYLDGDFSHRQRAFDIGVIQADSLQMDKVATLAKLQQIRAQQDEIVATEAQFLRQAGVDLVLADIPPLATKIAAAAGVPCWMMSNFGWDFIYRDWDGEFVAIADWIADCFGQCDRLFRLPFAESMAVFPAKTDVGLTGGNPRYSAAELRSRWQLEAPSDRTVLLTFGGLGLEQIPYNSLQDWPDWQFISFDQAAPDLPNLFKIPGNRLRPVDVMPLCGRVVSKPGFSTFSEACRLDIPIVTITREDFAEAPVLLNGIADVSVHQILPPEALFSGTWEFLHQPLSSPRTPETSISKNGNEEIAGAVVDYLQSSKL